MCALKQLRRPLRRWFASVAEDYVPSLFDIRRLHMQRRLRQRALRRVRHNDDAALRVDPPERENERPLQNKVAERADLENENVATKHGVI